jgi:glycosyltransferase involved in cell wall biosynthesis
MSKNKQKKIIINGIGCGQFGSKVILDEILKNTPTQVKILAIVVKEKFNNQINFPKNIKFIMLRHEIWGMYLRVFLELYINFLIAIKRYDQLINISNYGICLTKRQMLYIHNYNILNVDAEKIFGRGNANVLNRLALNSFLKNADKIFLQTEHIYEQLTKYCKSSNIPFPKKVIILRTPYPTFEDLNESDIPKKTFKFQFVYPASGFIHKRTELAIAGIKIARKKNKDIGLVITTNGADTIEEGVYHLGVVSRSQALQQFKISDALLFTSERETLGLPLLEALYYNKPAVLPNKPYAKEIFENTGIYFGGDNEEDVARAILELVNDYDRYINLVKIRRVEDQSKRVPWSKHWDYFLAVD